jgi:plasmid stabilization system protein ParE
MKEFEPAASDELDRLFAWIAKDNLRAALNMIARIEDHAAGKPRTDLYGAPRSC